MTEQAADAARSDQPTGDLPVADEEERDPVTGYTRAEAEPPF